MKLFRHCVIQRLIPSPHTHTPSAAPLHLWRQTCCIINLLHKHTALNQQMSNASKSPPYLPPLQTRREKSQIRPVHMTCALVLAWVSLYLTPINCPQEYKKRENSCSYLWSWTHNGSLIKLEGRPAAKAANPITSLHLLARNLIRFLIQLSAWSWAELARPGHCCLCPRPRAGEELPRWPWRKNTICWLSG